MGVSIRHVLCLFILFCLQCNGDTVAETRKAKKADKNVDLPLMKQHFPLKDGDNVYFWRLQKVGSSTMLSILMSYGYRYNFLPRRKGSSNAQCRRIAQCALDNPHQNQLFRNETSKLKKYVESKTPGAVKTSLTVTQTILALEEVTKSIPFKISLGHELCNLDEKYIRKNVACSFTNPDWPSQFKQGSPVKEIFMVRDPVSRAISVYYFWGELFKLAKVNKDIQAAERAKREKEEELEEFKKAATVSPGAGVTTVVTTKRGGGRETTTVQEDSDVPPSAKLRLTKGTTKSGSSDSSSSSSSRSGTSGTKSGKTHVTTGTDSDKDHVVINVKSLLAETPHSKRSSGRSISTHSKDKKRDIRQFGRLLGEEDPEVWEEVERLLDNMTDEEQEELEEEDYSYLSQLSTAAAPAAEEEGKGLKFPFKRSSRQLAQLASESAVVERAKPKLGGNSNYDNRTIDGRMFMYHGDETSVPPMEIAMAYASSLPFTPGMPGPSLSYSAFSNKLQDALEIVKSDRMATVVVERLDESLVVASHYLGWSLADMVVTKHRKALSSHPKFSEWPKPSIDAIRRKMNSNGEYLIYNASHAKLDERIAELKKKGVDVAKEVKTLNALQKRVTSICLDDTYLLNYKQDLVDRGYPPHASENKLRDVEEKYLENGHIFSFNREILCSFDVCGSCEAHALLYTTGKGGMSEGKSIEEAATLSAIPVQSIEKNIDFMKCPKKFPHPLPAATA